MAFELDTENVPDDPTQGFNVKPGSYHVLVSDVDEDGGNNGEMIVSYEVLSGTTPKQEGEVHRDYFSKSGKAQGRMATFAIAAGLISLEDFQAAKKGQKPLLIEWKDAVGSQICVDLAESTYEGKTKTKCGFGIYRVDSKKVRDKGIPLNQGMLKQLESRTMRPPLNMPSAEVAAAETAKKQDDPFSGWH